MLLRNYHTFYSQHYSFQLPFSRGDLGSWCFTHQYKNTTQFCFYAVPAASQNTNAKKRRHIVAVETVTVNLSPQLSDPNINNGRLMAGKFIDLTENFPEHDSIVPVPFLVATGWFTGGVEIRALTQNSITVRLLNGTDKDSGGYASFKLLFFE